MEVLLAGSCNCCFNISLIWSLVRLLLLPSPSPPLPPLAFLANICRSSGKVLLFNKLLISLSFISFNVLLLLLDSSEEVPESSGLLDEVAALALLNILFNVSLSTFPLLLFWASSINCLLSSVTFTKYIVSSQIINSYLSPAAFFISKSLADCTILPSILVLSNPLMHFAE